MNFKEKKLLYYLFISVGLVYNHLSCQKYLN